MTMRIVCLFYILSTHALALAPLLARPVARRGFRFPAPRDAPARGATAIRSAATGETETAAGGGVSGDIPADASEWDMVLSALET